MSEPLEIFTFQFFVNMAILITVAIFVTRWVFQVGKTQKHLKAQTKLLSEIAARQGVPDDTIKSITSEVNEES